MAYIEVVPAYGRDYTNQKSVLEDWKADKDFQISEAGFGTGARYGQYVTRTEAVNAGLNVIVRYAKLQKVVDVTGK